MRANWIWIRPNLQWSLETQSLFPPPLIQGYFRYAVGYPLSREATWRCTDPRIQHRDFLARMPSIRHTTKAGNRTAVQLSSSISMKMTKFRAEQGVLSWIGRTGTLGAKQSGTPFGSAFRMKTNGRTPSAGFNLQLSLSLSPSLSLLSPFSFFLPL